MFEDIGKQNIEICAAPVHCYAMNADGVASSLRFAAQNPQSRPKRLRSAAIAASVFATVGVCGMALLAWLGTNSPKAVIPTPAAAAGSHVPPVGVTADGAALAWSSQQSPPVSSMAAETDTQAPPALQIPLASNNAAVDRSSQVSSSRPALSEIGVAVVRGRQAPEVLQTTLNSGVAVVRGKQEASPLTITPNSGAAVVRGNQAPPTLQIAREAGTDVVRGTPVAAGTRPVNPADRFPAQ
jgi:hypothetical protein